MYLYTDVDDFGTYLYENSSCISRLSSFQLFWEEERVYCIKKLGAIFERCSFFVRCGTEFSSERTCI